MTPARVDRKRAVGGSTGLVVVTLVLGCTSPARMEAQIVGGGSISGRVVDQRGQPQRTLVELLSQGEALVDNKYTDSNGLFSFGGLVNGAYAVVIEAEGFQTLRQSVVIDQFTTPRVQLSLFLEPVTKTKAPLSPVVSGSASSERFDVRRQGRAFDQRALREFDEAKSREREGNDKGAMKHYEKALKIEPDFYPALNNLGALLLRQKDIQGAETAFRKSLKINPDDGEAYVNLGHLLYEDGKYGEALAQLQEGVKRSPDSAAGYFFLGSAYLKTGQWEKAEKDLATASKLDPGGMASAHLQLANLYLKRHNMDAAGAELEAYLRVNPSDSQAPAIRKMLANIAAHRTK